MNSKNRKASGVDDITNKMLKWGTKYPARNHYSIKKKRITNAGNVYNIPIFKKRSKKDPNNYRGITLLSSVLKILTKILAEKIARKADISEE